MNRQERSMLLDNQCRLRGYEDAFTDISLGIVRLCEYATDLESTLASKDATIEAQKAEIERLKGDYNHVVDALQKVKSCLDETASALTTLREKHRWIPIAEGLQPEDDQMYEINVTGMNSSYNQEPGPFNFHAVGFYDAESKRFTSTETDEVFDLADVHAFKRTDPPDLEVQDGKE